MVGDSTGDNSIPEEGDTDTEPGEEDAKVSRREMLQATGISVVPGLNSANWKNQKQASSLINIQITDPNGQPVPDTQVDVFEDNYTYRRSFTAENAEFNFDIGSEELLLFSEGNSKGAWFDAVDLSRNRARLADGNIELRNKFLRPLTIIQVDDGGMNRAVVTVWRKVVSGGQHLNIGITSISNHPLGKSWQMNYPHNDIANGICTVSFLEEDALISYESANMDTLTNINAKYIPTTTNDILSEETRGRINNLHPLNPSNPSPVPLGVSTLPVFRPSKPEIGQLEDAFSKALGVVPFLGNLIALGNIDTLPIGNPNTATFGPEGGTIDPNEFDTVMLPFSATNPGLAESDAASVVYTIPFRHNETNKVKFNITSDWIHISRTFDPRPGTVCSYQERFTIGGAETGTSDGTDLRSISYGETGTGEIDENDPTGHRGHYEPVSFQGDSGDVVTIRMNGDGDPYLKLRDPHGNIVAENDNAPGHLDSRIQNHTLESDGEYTIIATSHDNKATFKYDLRLEQTSKSGCPPPGTEPAWPMFQADLARTGHVPKENRPSTPVTEQWHFRTDWEVISSPAVDNGTVYVGGKDGYVYAVAAEDGAEQWRFRAGERANPGPAVVDGTVYVANWSTSDDGAVYALSADTGSEQWHFQPGNQVRTSPAVFDGTVYIGSRDNNVYALSASDGSEQWRFETNGRVSSSPAVANGNVYFGSGDGNVYALSAEDGSEQWRSRTNGPIRKSSPAVVEGTVYIGSYDNSVYALSTDDGSVRWRFQTGDVIRSSPAVTGEAVYIGSFDSNIYALSRADGTERWRFQTNGKVSASPAVADSAVFIGGYDGNLYALSADDGSEQWRFQSDTGTPGKPLIRSSPAVVDGSVYVGSSDYNLYALS